MEKIHIFSRYSVKSEKKSLVSLRGLMLFVIAFLVGRIVTFDIAAPFGVAYFAAYISENKTVTWRHIAVALLAFLGTATAGAGISLIKYMLVYVLFGLIYLSVTTLSDSRKDYTVSGMAGASMLISGIIFSAQSGFVAYDILMLALESAVCVFSVRLMQIALPLILSPSEAHRRSAEETAGLSFIAMLCIAGLSGTVIGGVDIGSSAAAAIIMLLAFAGGWTGGAAGGVAVGVIYGISRFPLTGIVGVYSFCGLAAGAMKRFNKAGVILGFFVANCVLSVYLGGFEGGAFKVLELVLGIILFALLPKTAVFETEEAIKGVGQNNKSSSVMFISQKLNKISCAFTGLAKTFSELINTEATDNFADITVFFDKVADKVCRRCGLKFICWEKQFSFTYDSMMKLAPIMKTKDTIQTFDLPQPFRSRCIKSEEFVGELSRVYSKHKLDLQWQRKVAESQTLAAQQLSGVSKIMDGIVSELDGEMEFDARLEKKIEAALEARGMKKCSVNAVKNSEGRYTVSIRQKRCAAGGGCGIEAAKVVSEILERDMDVCAVNCGDNEIGARCEIRLAERERFLIDCQAASLAKDNQSESGDSFTYMPVSDGKYIIILSDGMGSGKQAAKQSGITVSMLNQLLEAGFDKQSALKIINSALLIKSKEECFSTIDITIVDLFGGRAEFMKIGANSTFIKHGKKVEQIRASTLPAGILSEVDVESSSRELKSGDYIIMISDGIHTATDNWISDYISKLGDLSPHDMAQRILEESKSRKKGSVDDDMTVIISKILER
ncbi:MAG: Stage II sporulation protein E [Firmicutes bacterium ADurb.Bin193]|nr:MAG: Stage II sporulation protein E [Firmicutes bacterium ADurb.Bin193]